MIKEHIQNEKNTPLLVFPEGVCVNNQYCVMFKKGAFELGAVVYPIAIKYNPLFVDAFWNSRKQSFIRHMFNLMTSWAVVCDVWYLEPQTIRPNESPTQFANRIKALIAKKAGLINVHWDGYLKYFRPSPKFLETKQRVFAQSIVKRYTNRQSEPSPVLAKPTFSSSSSQSSQTSSPALSSSSSSSSPLSLSSSDQFASPVLENGMAVANGKPESSKNGTAETDHPKEKSVDYSKANGVAHMRKVKMDATEIDR